MYLEKETDLAGCKRANRITQIESHVDGEDARI
jgi:hypothetical protein